MKLLQAVELYVQRKRDAGIRFNEPAKQLHSFLRHCGNIALRRITVAQVTAFLEGSGVRPGTWAGKRGTLRHFFEYWMLRGRLKSCPVPARAPKVPQTFVPYIYSQSELRRLLDTVPRCQRVSACVMSAATFRTLLLFLYGTGMRVSEALRLRLTDVDLRRGVVTIPFQATSECVAKWPRRPDRSQTFPVDPARRQSRMPLKEFLRHGNRWQAFSLTCSKHKRKRAFAELGLCASKNSSPGPVRHFAERSHQNDSQCHISQKSRLRNSCDGSPQRLSLR